MTKGQKVLTYFFGFVFGCVILMFIPRDTSRRSEHPWHAQTAPEGTYPMTLVDDLGRTVTIEKQPRYFVSLAPSITEILFAMGMGDHLLAVTQWCAYPPEARKLRDSGAQVGSIDKPDREAIAAYRPDLIIGTDFTSPEVYSALENPPRTMAIALSHGSMEDVVVDIATIGKAIGVPGKALALISDLEEKRRAVEKELEPHMQGPEKKVLFLLSIEDDGQPAACDARSALPAPIG